MCPMRKSFSSNKGRQLRFFLQFFYKKLERRISELSSLIAAQSYFQFESQHEVVLSNSSWSKRLLVCQLEFVLWSMTVVIGLGSVVGWGPGCCPITVSGHRLEMYSQHLKLNPDFKVISITKFTQS